MRSPEAIMVADRRATNRAAGVCINGASHGEATHGVLCLACRIVHRGVAKDRASALAIELPADRRVRR